MLKNFKLAAFLLTVGVGASSFAEGVYKTEDVLLPEGVPPEVGAIAFGEDGYLYLCLRRSDVIRAKPVADPKGFEWNTFASGFHNGCGMVVSGEGEILVSQMAELTSAKDTDGDGKADQYRNVADGWGLSGNYHETNALCSDGEGGYFLAIGTASYNGPVFNHTKGEFSEIGRRGRNFSGVLYRGWIMRLDASGKLTPWASGFRMHNGIYTDPDGRTWCSDNQGDWKAATPFYHIEKGNFYGHPSSLVWDEDWPAGKDPLATYRGDLEAYNAHRTPPAVILPHGELCRSGAEPVMIPRDGSFGAHFAGQFILPDNNSPRLARIMVEEVDGSWQGMATIFQQKEGLRSGNNRTRFSPDGKTLYIGQTVRGWGKPAEGLQRIIYQGGTPFDLATMTITPTGFRLKFTKPTSLLKASELSMESFTYQPKWQYGSRQENKLNHEISEVKVIDDLTQEITVNGFGYGKVYHLKLPGLKDSSGGVIGNRDFYYNVLKMPK